MINEILIKRISERFNITQIEAVQTIEKYIINGNIDTLLLIAGLKGSDTNV